MPPLPSRSVSSKSPQVCFAAPSPELPWPRLLPSPGRPSTCRLVITVGCAARGRSEGGRLPAGAARPRPSLRRRRQGGQGRRQVGRGGVAACCAMTTVWPVARGSAGGAPPDGPPASGSCWSGWGRTRRRRRRDGRGDGRSDRTGHRHHRQAGLLEVDGRRHRLGHRSASPASASSRRAPAAGTTWTWLGIAGGHGRATGRERGEAELGRTAPSHGAERDYAPGTRPWEVRSGRLVDHFRAPRRVLTPFRSPRRHTASAGRVRSIASWPNPSPTPTPR